MLYFVTPIFYPAEMVPNYLKFLLKINPIYLMIRPFQISLWKFDLNIYLGALLTGCIAVLVVTFLAVMTWRYKKNELYLNI